MSFRKASAALLAGGLVSFVGWNVALAQPMTSAKAAPGSVYSLHTAAVGGCPALDWHIVVGENNTFSGLVGADDMKVVFRVTGAMSGDHVNLKMTGQEIGGTRTGAVNGELQSDGRLAMTIGGLPVGAACQGKTVYIKWLNPYASGASGGG
jgi:hypothetical protein